ncbi:MAG TPA: hypothetical protein VFX96_07165, partial [Pyrinomonadaceae bacterium]|nr:hypothetical protein [Pyrinomonadaceae bacterium]
DKLRRTKLIAPTGHHGDTDLDAHPLLREHFGQELKHHHPATWREANSRLFDHLKDTTKEFPDTLDEMTPLYLAVAHGCEAGRHQKALDEVYWRRVQRGNRYFSVKNLGAYGANLTALRGFFDTPWQHLILELTEDAKALVLAITGFALRALGQLKESIQPMQANLEVRISQRNWRNAAIAANNLSETYLTIGDLSQSLTYARRGVEFADQSGDSFLRMSTRTTLADTFQQAGRLSEAEDTFREAEKMQKEDQPEFPILYSLWGFRYCDFLLGQGKYQDVQARAVQTLALVTPQGWLLDIALDCLSMGRAYLLQARREASADFAEATNYLKRAVNGLREAGNLDDLPRGLLARAELYRAMGEFGRAQADLDEVMPIAMRGSMGLYEADCHLEYARLHLARGKKGLARASWWKAQEMILRMGYGRRDKDVREIEQLLRDEGSV